MYLLGEGHGTDTWCGSELQEGNFGRQQPATQQPEQWVVAKGNHGLHHPEDGSVVSQQVVFQWDILIITSLLEEALHMFVEPRLVPLSYVVNLKNNTCSYFVMLMCAGLIYPQNTDKNYLDKRNKWYS